MDSSLISRNVMLPARTSIRLEAPYWEALAEIAATLGVTIHVVVQQANERRAGGTLTSAVRVFVLAWFRARHS